MAADNRPLSPHLGIYRWQISNTLSILHRLTGVALAVGSLILVAWILAAASGPEEYTQFSSLLAGLPGRLVLIAVSYAFFYHLFNGVRHLFWDAGMGFELGRARTTGWAVVIASIATTASFWLVLA